MDPVGTFHFNNAGTAFARIYYFLVYCQRYVDLTE
jgi:hypothetical protein